MGVNKESWNPRYRNDKNKPEPSLDIEHCLQSMVPPPLSARHTHLVRSDTLNCNDFVTFAQILGLHGGVRHQKDEQNAEDNSAAAAEDEDRLVLEDVLAFDMSKAERD